MLNSKNNNIYGCYIYPAILSAVKKELSDSDKILLCKVILLCQNKDKTCYAGNPHLSKELGKSPKEITRGVSRLVNKGLLNRKIEKSDKKNFNKRYLFITKKASLYLNSGTTPLPNSGDTSPPESGQYNNKKVNLNNVNKCKGTSGRSLCLSLEEYVSTYEVNQGTVNTLRYYLDIYLRNRNQDHPKLKIDYWERIKKNIESFNNEYDLNIEHWKIIIDKHFATDYKKDCDYNLLHFTSYKIMENRYYEKIYRQ